MNPTTDRRESGQRVGSKSAAVLRTWSQRSLLMARSVLSDIGGYLAVTEEGGRLEEWRERLRRSASSGSIGFSLDDLVSREPPSEDPALTRLEKVLFEDDDRPEFDTHGAAFGNGGPSPFGKALFTSPELLDEKNHKWTLQEPTPSSLSAHSAHVRDEQTPADDRILIHVCPANGDRPEIHHTPQEIGSATTAAARSLSNLHTKPQTTPFHSLYTGAYKLPLKESTELGVAAFTRQQQSLRREMTTCSPDRRPLRSPSVGSAASSAELKLPTVCFSGEVSVTEFVPTQDRSPRSLEEETPAVSVSPECVDDRHQESATESRRRKYIRRITKCLKKSPSKSILKGSPKKRVDAARPLPLLEVEPTRSVTPGQVSPEEKAARAKTSPGRPLPELPLSDRQSSSSLPTSPSSSASSLTSSVTWPWSTDSLLSSHVWPSDVGPPSTMAESPERMGSPEAVASESGQSDRSVSDVGMSVNYRQLKELETQQEDNQQFLDLGSKQALRMTLLNRKQRINSALKEAREKYSKSLSEVETAMFEETGDEVADHPYLRTQLDSLPVYSPIVILIISIVQIVVFSTLCALGGTADTALEHTVLTANNIHTFMGRESVQRVTSPNLWIGPTMTYWISQGATFAPCMRDDYVTNLYLAQQRFDLSVPLGCCELPARNLAGTTTQAECDTLTDGTGSWRATQCGSRLPGESALAAHVMKPCCYGIMGKCKLTALQHCTFVNGVFNPSGEEHCSKVNCLSETCGPGDLSSDSTQPYKPRPSALTNQGWRWLLSPWLHAGLIHLVVVVAVQCIVGVRIERMVGGVRLALIYVICGVGGNMTGAVFSPYTPQLGGAAAACGLLGCACVELLQAWTLVPRALCKLLTLLSVLTVLLMAGTLPLVDNWAQLGGFVLGLLSALVFLPYIVLGRWDARRKRCLVVFGFVTLVLFYAVLLVMFYYVQGDFCPACRHFNCIPYVPDVCHQTENDSP